MLIKICGIRDVDTALTAAAAGADAIGLNFYAKSPRVVEPAVAADITAGLMRHAAHLVEPVGVFVNHTPEQIRAICAQCRLRTIQLHGEEPPEAVAELAVEFRVIRAFRVGDEGLDEVGTYFAACEQMRAMPWAFLVDANVNDHYGGTGKPAPWQLLRRQYKTADWPKLFLAGGLTPENVAEAIRIVGPWGVDVASGVESALACKDATMVRQFVLNAKKRP